MTTPVIVTLCLFVANFIFGLLWYIVTNMFLKKLDELNASFKELSGKLEQYVKIQDHKEDFIRIEKRVEKIEDKIFGS